MIQLSYDDLQMDSINEYVSRVSSPDKESLVQEIYEKVKREVSDDKLKEFIDEYNRLSEEGKSDGFDSFITDLDRYVGQDSNLNRIKNMYSDPSVAAPANDMIAIVTNIKATAKQRQADLKKTEEKNQAAQKVDKAVDKAKIASHKVVDAYKKFTKPARELYDAVDKSVQGGGSNVYGEIASWGKHI